MYGVYNGYAGGSVCDPLDAISELDCETVIAVNAFAESAILRLNEAFSSQMAHWSSGNE